MHTNRLCVCVCVCVCVCPTQSIMTTRHAGSCSKCESRMHKPNSLDGIDQQVLQSSRFWSFSTDTLNGAPSMRVGGVVFSLFALEARHGLHHRRIQNSLHAGACSSRQKTAAGPHHQHHRHFWSSLSLSLSLLVFRVFPMYGRNNNQQHHPPRLHIFQIRSRTLLP